MTFFFFWTNFYRFIFAVYLYNIELLYALFCDTYSTLNCLVIDISILFIQIDDNATISNIAYLKIIKNILKDHSSLSYIVVRWDPHRSRSWVWALEFTTETTTNFDGKLMKIVTLIICLNIKKKNDVERDS